ncbi:MAG: Ig-like domain-containing protein, partial [Planctomycetota bacterium]|nr:Ig-like domain-containing protein [Planctomycetota bacterium]
VHVVAYIGDINTDQQLDLNDASLAMRIDAGLVDGITQVPLADPRLIVDVNGTQSTDRNDAALLLRKGIGLAVDEIPDDPDPFAGVMPQTGPESRLFVPQNLNAATGETITVPVMLENTEETQIAIGNARVVLTYDDALFSVGNARLGAGLVGFTSEFDISTPGRIVFGAISLDSVILNPDDIVDLFLIDFTVKESAPVGSSVLNLIASSGTLTTVLHNKELSTVTLVQAPTNQMNDATDGRFTIIDTLNPTVTVNIVDASLSDGDNASNVTFEFSEDVAGFDASDVSVTGGTLSSFSAVDGDSFTAIFTASDGIETTGSVNVGNGYSDAAGNAGATGADSVSIDTLNPTVTVNIVDDILRNADNTSNVTFVFTEVVTGFEPEDVVISGGTLSNLSGSGTNYTATFIAADEISETGSVAVRSDSYVDLTGNSGLSGADTVAISTKTAVTITLVGSQNLVVIASSQGAVRVLINDEPDVGVPIAYASELESLKVFGGSGSNVIDLSAITSDAFSTPNGVQVTVNAGGGADSILGSLFDDVLNGEDGNDTLNGGLGNDTLDGGADEDTLVVTTEYYLNINATETIGAGTDSHVSFEKGVLEGNWRNNRLDATHAPFSVELIGLSGNDTLLGGAFNDTLDGGDGYDVAEIHGSNIVLTDTVAPGSNGDNIADVEGLQLIASQSGSIVDAGAYTLGSVTIVGSSGNDTLKGGSGDDFIFAGSGSDEVHGGAGDDFIHGGSGSDVLSGDAGDDTISGGAGRDAIDGGDDSDLVHGGAGPDTVHGGAGDDNLYGGAGRDSIDGDDGSDSLIGGGGADNLAGGNGSDSLNGIARDGNFNDVVGRDTLIGGNRPEAHPAPVETLVQTSDELADVPSFQIPRLYSKNNKEIDEAFLQPLLLELLEL